MKNTVAKVVTVDEANRMLPLVRKITADILSAGMDMKAMSRETMTGEHASRLELRMAQLNTYLQELEDLGCSYKDWDFKTGLVEFPGELEGKPVLLSWRSDESSVNHFHDMAEAHEKRRPLPALAAAL
jgi:hypothetical protein